MLLLGTQSVLPLAPSCCLLFNLVVALVGRKAVGLCHVTAASSRVGVGKDRPENGPVLRSCTLLW